MVSFESWYVLLQEMGINIDIDGQGGGGEGGSCQ